MRVPPHIRLGSIHLGAAGEVAVERCVIRKAYGTNKHSYFIKFKENTHVLRLCANSYVYQGHWA